MDILNIVAEKAELEIRHPATDEPTGLVFSLVPLDDPKVKMVIRQIKTKLLRKRKNRFSPEEEESNAIDIMVSAICGLTWKNDASWGGKTPKYSEKVVREIIEPDTSHWIREQISDQLGESSDFFTS